MSQANQLQPELVDKIRQILLEGGGNTTIVGADGKRWQLNLTPIPVIGTTPRMDDYFDEAE